MLKGQRDLFLFPKSLPFLLNRNNLSMLKFSLKIFFLKSFGNFLSFMASVGIFMIELHYWINVVADDVVLKVILVIMWNYLFVDGLWKLWLLLLAMLKLRFKIIVISFQFLNPLIFNKLKWIFQILKAMLHIKGWIWCKIIDANFFRRHLN